MLDEYDEGVLTTVCLLWSPIDILIQWCLMNVTYKENLEKLFRENKTSPLSKTPEKDFHKM